MALARPKKLNQKQLATLGWCLLALALLVAAASNLMTLLNPGLSDEPHEITSVRRKQKEFDQLLADNRANGLVSGTLDRVLAGHAPEKQRAGVDVAAQAQEEPILLPHLAGVVAVIDAQGRTDYRALFAGQDLGENDRLGDFTILRISAREVVLGRGGKRWILPVPEVPFSKRLE